MYTIKNDSLLILVYTIHRILWGAGNQADNTRLLLIRVV